MAKDAELIKDFIRVHKSKHGVQILVCNIHWPHPHTPTSDWEVIEVLSEFSSEEEVQLAIDRILNNKKYFKFCKECKERNPIGWMHEPKLCMQCAELHHGVDY